MEKPSLTRKPKLFPNYLNSTFLYEVDAPRDLKNQMLHKLIPEKEVQGWAGRISIEYKSV